MQHLDSKAIEQQLILLLEESSRSMADHFAEGEIDKIIVRNPSIANQRKEKIQTLSHQKQQELLACFKQEFAYFKEIPALLAPYLTHSTASFRKEFIKDFEKILAVQNLPTDLALLKPLSEPYTLQNYCGVSNQTLDWLFSVAIEYANAEQWRPAITLLRFFNFLNPYLPKSWLKFGYCYQQLSQYESAIEAYAMVNLLNQDIPQARVLAAHCYLLLKLPDDAKVEVAELEELLKRDPQKNDTLQSHLNTLKEKIVHAKAGGLK